MGWSGRTLFSVAKEDTDKYVFVNHTAMIDNWRKIGFGYDYKKVREIGEYIDPDTDLDELDEDDFIANLDFDLIKKGTRKGRVFFLIHADDYTGDLGDDVMFSNMLYHSTDYLIWPKSFVSYGEA